MHDLPAGTIFRHKTLSLLVYRATHSLF
jgi:hypothetical protein